MSDKIFYTYVEEPTDDQVHWGACQDPRGLLEVGKTYEVERIDVHSWHTKVFLVGVDSGQGFNDVSFRPASPPVCEHDQTEAHNYYPPKACFLQLCPGPKEES